MAAWTIRHHYSASVDAWLRIGDTMTERGTPRPLVINIIKMASAMSKIPVETITGPSRKRYIARVRVAVIYVARQYSAGSGYSQRYSFPRIGQILNRDHSTIIHAYDHFDVYCKQTPWLRDFANELQEKLEANSANVEEHFDQEKLDFEQQEAAEWQKEIERTAKQLRHELPDFHKTESVKKPRSEKTKLPKQNVIPTYDGRAKNDFKPLLDEEIDCSHKAMANTAKGSRDLLEAILKERKHNV